MKLFRNITRFARYRRIKMVRGYKLKHTLPQYKNCKNCETQLQGIYCHKCGQYALDTNQTLWKFIAEYMSNVYQTDGRALNTLRFLLFYPGYLSIQFAKGRINSFVHPMKMLLFCSIIFMTIAFIATPSNKEMLSKFDKVLAPDSINIASSKLDKQILNVTVKVKEPIDSINLSQKNTPKEDAKYKKILLYNTSIGVIKQYFPLFMLLCLPLYGLILKWFFRKRYENYISHFVFAIHINILLTILLLLMGIAIIWLPETWGYAIFASTSALFFIYVLIASWNFYKGNAVANVIKSTLALSIYSLLCVIIISILLFVVLVKNATEL